MRSFAVVALLSIAACPRGPATPDVALRPPVVRLMPDTVRYHVVEHRRVEQIVQGQSLVSDIRTTVRLTATVTPTDDGFAARFTVDSVSVEGGAGPPAAAARPSRGAEFRARVRPDGRVEALEPDRSPDQVMDRLRSALWEFLPRLPTEGARPGVRWTDTTEYAAPAADVELAVEGHHEHAVGTWTTWRGHAALPVTTETAYTIAGSGRQSGQAVGVEGAGRRWTSRYLDPSGRYLGGTSLDSATIDVRLVASGVTIPVRQWSADTVEARP